MLQSAPFQLVSTTAADIYVDSNDYAGIAHAANSLASDINLVTGKTPNVKSSSSDLSSSAVIVGSIGKCSVIDNLISQGKVNVSEVRGKWEAYTIVVVDNPISGVLRGLIIVGSDKRGTIYGVYKISEMIGVSPWIWWADSNPIQQSTLTIAESTIVQGEPSVKYRGIFLNDEAPALSTFVRQFGSVSTSGSSGYNHNFYIHVFELILRLKGNYLWPAMWNNAFWIDDTQNPILADEYGIVMGTSHQEFLVSSDKEWSWSNRGNWSYLTNKANMLDFWEKNLEQRKIWENVYTMGMRGQGDQPILPNGTDDENIQMLNQVLADQRELLKVVNSDPSKVPQMVTLYKEVESFYYKGWNKIIPDDVILVLCDDNHGNLRSLPTEENRNRAGGFGMYYHFDYHGGPRGYRWINTSPLEKIREQMMTAYDYGVKKLWIVNVGDLKPNELPTDYWMNLAYDVDTWGKLDSPEKFYKHFAEREFGSEYRDDIADILHTYSQINNIRKPEVVSYNTFHVTKYDEAVTLLNRYELIAQKAEKISSLIPSMKKDTFYQLVLYPTRASMNVFRLMINLGLNKEYAAQGRISANSYAEEARANLAQDTSEMDYINNELAGGKWKGFGSEFHIGQTTWDPRTSQFTFTDDFELSSVSSSPGSQLLVVPQGNYGATQLPPFTNFGKEVRYIDICNTKSTPFYFTTVPNQNWIVLNQTSGNVSQDVRVLVNIDWSKVPISNIPNGTITVSGADSTVVINVSLDIFDTSILNSLPEKTFIETDGYVSILSKDFSSSVPNDKGAKWSILPGYGREESSVKVVPNQVGALFKPGVDSPYLEYQVYIRTPGDIDIVVQFAPTTGPDPRTLTLLQYGIMFGDNSVQVVHTLPIDFVIVNEGNNAWADGVENAVRTVTTRSGNICASKHSVSKAGLYTLRIYMIDDLLVLQKILIGTNKLERYNTTARNVNTNIDPNTRLVTSSTKSVTIPANSLPRIFIGSLQGNHSSFDTYFGPPETFFVGKQ